MMLGLKDKAGDMLEQQLPKVQALVSAQLGSRGREIAADEALLTRCFGNAYEFLPAPVRMLVKRERFVAFCLDNRHRLVPAS